MAEHKNSVYRKISEDISAKIASGEYSAGTMLAPERKLMEVYGVERTTVRRALEVLVKDGKIVKKTGLGTFVADPDSIPVSEKENKIEKIVPTKKAKRKGLPSGITLKNDYSAAAKLLFTKLAELGHEKVMFAGKDGEIFAAVTGEATRCGKYDSEIFALVDDRNTPDYIFERMWSGLRTSKPTAIVADCAETAVKIIERAERMRISVPEELTVIAVNTNMASGVCGCIFDKAKTEKKVALMLEDTQDCAMSAVTVAVQPEFAHGETLVQAKSNRSGFGSMSAYLL